MPEIEDALRHARGAIIEAACRTTVSELLNLSKTLYPGVKLGEAVNKLTLEAARFAETFPQAVLRACEIESQIDKRKRTINSSQSAAESKYENLAKQMSATEARKYSPKYNAEPLLKEISILSDELAAIHAYLGVGNYDRLPNSLKTYDSKGD